MWIKFLIALGSWLPMGGVAGRGLRTVLGLATAGAHTGWLRGGRFVVAVRGPDLVRKSLAGQPFQCAASAQLSCSCVENGINTTFYQWFSFFRAKWFFFYLYSNKNAPNVWTPLERTATYLVTPFQIKFVAGSGLIMPDPQHCFMKRKQTFKKL